MKTYQTSSSLETKKLGAKIAKEILNGKLGNTARVIALVGNLGAGKTTFTQGFMRGLGVRGKVTSPTFVIVKRYALRKPLPLLEGELEGERFSHVYHADLYRINNAKHLASLEFKKILKDPANIVLVEWADRTRRIFPKETVWVRFECGEKGNERILTISSRTLL